MPILAKVRGNSYETNLRGMDTHPGGGGGGVQLFSKSLCLPSEMGLH